MSAQALDLWTAGQALGRAGADVSPEGRGAPPLIFVTDPLRTPEPWRIVEGLPAGAGVILRLFGAPDALQTARRVRAAATTAGVIFLMGLDADLAEAVGADGVHLPERALDQAPDLRARRPEWRLSGAVHGLGAVRRAEAAGVDFALASPVFKPGGASRGEPLGPAGLAALVAATALPLVALGGVTAANVHELARTGARGIAAVDGVVQAFGPGTI